MFMFRIQPKTFPMLVLATTKVTIKSSIKDLKKTTPMAPTKPTLAGKTKSDNEEVDEEGGEDSEIGTDLLRKKR